MSQDSGDDDDVDPTPQSAMVETPRSRPSANEGQDHQEISKPPYWKRLTFWSVLSSVILTIITIILAFIAYWQLEAAKEAVKISNKAIDISASANKISSEALNVSQGANRISEQSLRISEQTLKLGERAWVMARGPKLLSVIAVGEVPRIYVRIQNSGKSPALKVRVRHTTDMVHKLPNGPMPKWPIIGNVSEPTIAPDEYHRSIVPLGIPLTEAYLTHLKRAELSIVSYGTITYFDIFKEQHHTDFCLILRDVSGTDLSPCGQWNEAN